jgi:ubiquitin-conjugating enzyme E2 S
MRTIAKEVRKLASSPPAGVTFIPNPEENIAEIFADLEGPADTPFEGGVFRIKLVIGRDYPASPPKGFFITKIYHPNVAQDTGEICVNTLKKDWKEGVGLCRIMKVIWCLLVVPFPESSLNDEAGKLFMDSYDDYARKARLMTKIHAIKDDAVVMTSSKKASKSPKKKSSSSISSHFAAKKKSMTTTTTAKDSKKKTKAKKRLSKKKSMKRL